MNNLNYAATQPQLIGQWKVVYMGEIPGFPGILGKAQLSLFENYFTISSKKLGNHFINYSDVISWIIIKERSSYASANSNAFFKPRHIRIQYIDKNKRTNTILLEMVQSIWLPKNAKICKYMLSIMQAHRIFDKFSSKNQDNSSADVMVQIEKLAKLHKDGILSDTEFQNKKEELLRRI